MAPHHRGRIGISRRRVEDEGEDDGFVAGDVGDDSMSEGTISSHEDDEDGDGEGSETSEGVPAETPRTGQNGAHKKDMGHNTSHAQRRGRGRVGGAKKGLFASKTSDTEAMLNGMKLGDAGGQLEEIHFDEMKEGKDEGDAAGNTTASRPPKPEKQETLQERRQREQEQYNKKKDRDPAFVPNRGGFFLHDNRVSHNSNNHRMANNNKSKSKPHGLIVDSSMGRRSTQKTGIIDGQWSHDLHESIIQEVDRTPTQSRPAFSHSTAPYPAKPVPTAPRSSPPNRSFSSTVLVGNVSVIVCLPGMTNAIPYSAVPKKQHTRLPEHRPPLRRDKPVRISFPGKAPRYIYPAMERSFIFIPRALRPNQQSYQRGRGRGGFYSSRRTSMYSGSVYTPSVSMSRRSSMGRDVSRNSVRTPGGSTIARPPVIPSDAGRPVVRLPPAVRISHPAGPQFQPSAGPAGHSGLQPSAYPASQNPPYRENRPTPNIPMHQPRPQKTVSVSDIEQPMTFPYNPPHPQQEQPFHQQVPPPMNGQAAAAADPAAMYPSHTRQISHPPPSTATPLSHIPERAIHAQPFQPVPYPAQPPYYAPPVYPGPPGYPATGTEYPPYAGPVPPGGPPSFVPQSPYGAPAQPAADQPSMNHGTVAHESNGTVYFYDTSQLPPTGGYPNPQYPAPPQGGVVGMGGMMTPPGPGYYYGHPPPNGTVYYP